MKQQCIAGLGVHHGLFTTMMIYYRAQYKFAAYRCRRVLCSDTVYCGHCPSIHYINSALFVAAALLSWQVLLGVGWDARRNARVGWDARRNARVGWDARTNARVGWDASGTSADLRWISDYTIFVIDEEDRFLHVLLVRTCCVVFVKCHSRPQ